MFYARPLSAVTLLSCHALIPFRRAKLKTHSPFESGNARYFGRGANF